MCDREGDRALAALAALAAVILLAGSCAGSDPSSMPSPALELHVVSAPGDATAFLPDAISAPPGTLVRVTFSNASNQAHNLTFGSPIAAGTKTIVDAGQSDAATFTTPAPGTYEFVCTIHMGMSGTLVVS